MRHDESASTDRRTAAPVSGPGSRRVGGRAFRAALRDYFIAPCANAGVDVLAVIRRDWLDAAPRPSGTSRSRSSALVAPPLAPPPSQAGRRLFGKAREAVERHRIRRRPRACRRDHFATGRGLCRVAGPRLRVARDSRRRLWRSPSRAPTMKPRILGGELLRDDQAVERAFALLAQFARRDDAPCRSS
mgnify:CR=1 FL=1